MVLRMVSYTSVIKADRQKWFHTSGDRFMVLDTKLDNNLSLFSQPIWKKDSYRLSSALHTGTHVHLYSNTINKSIATSLNLPMIKKLSSKKTMKYSKINYIKYWREKKPYHS